MLREIKFELWLANHCSEHYGRRVVGSQLSRVAGFRVTSVADLNGDPLGAAILHKNVVVIAILQDSIGLAL